MSEISQPVTQSKLNRGLEYLRFNRSERIEHWTFITSFIILAITGLVQKFPFSPISDWLVVTVGGITNLRTIHHIAATIMMVVVVYHVGAIIYRIYVQRSRMTMLPDTGDVKNAYLSLLFYIGIRKNHVQQGRYTFEEKMEYWAVVWGTVIMVVTGFMMWNPIATTKILAGEFIPAAKYAHGAEAILAVLSILLWHFYHVLIRTFNRSMFTGKLKEKDMLEDHPIELADIKAGTANTPVTKQGVNKRKRVFFPVYGVTALIAMVGIFYFVTFEQTATVVTPPSEAETAQVFVPFTPTPLPTSLPTPTMAAGLELTFEGSVASIFDGKCIGCHNSSSKIGGLDLSSYQGALKGGQSGPGIVPGDPMASMVIAIQSAGGHPGQLSADEIALITEWINAGAPEK
jgi:formate dehydrogenase gamma subunit